MEKMFIVRAVGVDELGVETPTTIPMKQAEAPEADLIVEDLDAQYPHLKHRVVEIEELKTPGQVEDWQHSYLGTVMGTDSQEGDLDKKNA
ncbi:hypothetical protein LX87_04885 [Larkinella arboricola]|uniref:Uncharacterized protein n=1 Tax=Larkinella arboricola TaxID=643671 RepID=A0A327WLC0_LARAB|nr:hypothetical protein [Larkinella arboricola]RAJ92555.1 hypothetical protein LX87_04885 [Larkinella arboricola]